MVFQNRKHARARIVLVLALIAGTFGLAPIRASAEKSTEPVSQGEDCDPNGGSMWTPGPSMPDSAFQVHQELGLQGIAAAVEAKGYGETDSCGTYTPHGVDFTVRLADTAYNNSLSEQALADAVLRVLVEFGKPNLGNIKLFSARGELIPVTRDDVLPTARTTGIASLGEPTTKKVYVIVYDPRLSNGQTLTERMRWNDHATITQQTIDFFSQVTNGKLNYTVVDTAIVNDWPELVDGYKYTEQQYLAVWSNPSLHHEPKGANYNKIVNSPEFDVCGKLNRGEIDELWIYNAPWFGFYESTLVGPGAYPFNSSPVGGPHHCNKILPIMGPNVERTVNEAVHNFGHRTEATLTKVYGSWQQNNISHTWNQFSLIKAQSPSYSYSGCGNVHYPPNSGMEGYDYINRSTVLSNCGDFVNYPNLGAPLQVAQPITCSAWGCTEINYYRYWFGHFPANPGCGPDTFANDWWNYIADPGAAVHPSDACLPDKHVISGNVGAGGVVLRYTDGVEKHVTTDSYGNYFLTVSNHWSGRITPSEVGYLFSPAFQDYIDVQTDLYVQDYTAETIDVYVNAATGDNTNSCLSIDSPCRNIQEAINKAGVGAIVYVASGIYLFSTNASPNVLILRKDITLSGGWDSDFTLQEGVSIIDGANVNNGILMHMGTVVVENFIVQNSISSNSGAIYMINGNLTLKRSVLRDNVATSKGAGVFIDNGVFNMINSTISGNRAGDSGGGIYASLSSGASVNIQNSTISYNSASRGGGISQTNGTYQITNTIIANNSSTTANPDCNGTLATASFNIIENMTGCSISNGNNNLHVDPEIDVNLTGNLPLHVTLPGSVAVDAGDDQHCPAIDQRGVARPQGQHCDIGAYEYDPPRVPTTTMVTTSPNPSEPGQPVLATATVSSASGTPTGTVEFSLDGTELCTATLTNSTATCNLTFTQAGTVTVAYHPDSTQYASSFTTVGQMVGSSTTVTTVTDTPDPSLQGDNVNIHVLVDNRYGGTTPSGTVEVTTTAGNCTIPLNDGQGNCSLVFNVLGTSTITANYTPADFEHLPSIGIASHEVLAAPPPAVSSIVRADSDPTDAASVNFIVTFSKPVSGVSTTAPFNDFVLTTTGVTSASITGVNGSGSTWTVTVNTGSGNGTLRLDIPATATITDLTGNPLADLPFTGATYTIDKAPGPGIYDDRDARWTFSNGWTDYDGTGPYNQTSRYTNVVGSQAQFTFDGNQFAFTYLKASNRGSIDVYVDDVKITRINARSTSTLWQQTWTSPTFTPGIHTVRFVHAGGGTYVDVDALQIFAPPPAVPAGTYDDRDTSWAFSSGWTSYSGAGPVNDTDRYISVPGSDAQITFNGNRFIFTYVKASNRGLIDVYVDGTKISQINAKSTTTTWQATWTSPAFTPGIHTVRFVHAGGGTYIDVDAIQILASLDVAAPAAIGDLTASAGMAAGTVDLSWAAPGDDGSSGTATSYLVRYSTSAISNEAAWNTATPVTTGIPIPQASGQPEGMIISGLTPGVTYYFAVRAQDEEPNLGGLSNSPSAAAQSSTPANAGTYDDTDINWIYSGTWTTYNGTGPYNNTFHYANTVGSEAQFTFNGTGFTFTYLKASNRGSIDIYVDGIKVGTLNAKSTGTAWLQVWTSPTFTSGTHTVRFVHAGGGTYVDVDAITILP